MTALVPADEIEAIVGVKRHLTRHYGRAVSAEQVVYILHSQDCKDLGNDLRDCRYSQALDRGIDEGVWMDHDDEPVRLAVNRSGRLIPVVPGMRLSS